MLKRKRLPGWELGGKLVHMLEDRRKAGAWLVGSAALAACMIVVVVIWTLSDWLGSAQGQRWYYAASWVNAVLGFYCWMAFWVGIILRSSGRWARVWAIVLALGIAVFALSGYEELTK